MKKDKPTRMAHTPLSPKGHGDNYGQGLRNKVGRMIDGLGMETIPNSKLKKPPKNLA